MWSGHEYRLCQVGDAFTTGSSIMPQKKNPVVAELVRGRAGRTTGALVQLLTTVKGVTLGYSCDLQEDKPFLWQSIDTYLSSLRIVEQQTRTLRFDPARGEDLCWDNFSTATELANYLVSDGGLSFRESRHVAGRVVGQLLARDKTLRDVGLVSELLTEAGHPIAVPVLRELLAPQNAMNGYTSAGGTSAASVSRCVQASSVAWPPAPCLGGAAPRRAVRRTCPHASLRRRDRGRRATGKGAHRGARRPLRHREGAVMKIVLAYSGGLDTSVALHWLQEKYDAEVIAFCADIGQLESVPDVRERVRVTQTVRRNTGPHFCPENEGVVVVRGPDAQNGSEHGLVIERVRTEDGTEMPARTYFRSMGGYLTSRP